MFRYSERHSRFWSAYIFFLIGCQVVFETRLHPKLRGDVYAAYLAVNKHFRERLSAINVNDATVNALMNLNCFADFTAFAIMKKTVWTR